MGAPAGRTRGAGEDAGRWGCLTHIGEGSKYRAVRDGQQLHPIYQELQELQPAYISGIARIHTFSFLFYKVRF